MTILQFSVAVINSAGLRAIASREVEITGSGEPLPPVIDSFDVSPSSGVVGTLFTITIIAHDVNNPPLPLTYAPIVSVNGGERILDLTLTDQPNVFTFVWQP